ncbi:winged helix-turn-helix domain-containing protein [Streptomyces sp. NPDC127110]|uniref:AfsR/SARP family transcriptional regulator n=1 Tax=Streptomyces sp. NPDC127110 TaxID=3345362 RepID=UPI00363EE3AB
MITMKVLGPFRAEVDGRPVDTRGRLGRMVLLQLLLARGAVVPTERIIERLWPTRVPPSAQTSLHAYVARLRRALEPERAPRTPARILVSAPYGYSPWTGRRWTPGCSRTGWRPARRRVHPRSWPPST